MKTIVITSQKGGSGKTTLAASLSVAAEQAKDGPVVIIDTDPQNTLATWWNARDAETPQLAPVSLRDLPEKSPPLPLPASLTVSSTPRRRSPSKAVRFSSSPIWS